MSETKSCKPQVLNIYFFKLKQYFSLIYYLLIFRFSCPFYTFLCVTSFHSALAADERNRPLPMKVHSCRPSASHDPQTDLKTKREVRAPPRYLLLNLLTGVFLWMSHLTSLPRRCTQSRGVAATTCRPDPQTATTAICRPSPVPAVPLALVAPATCQSNQNDLGEDSGQFTLVVHPTIIVSTVACMLIIVCLSFFFFFFFLFLHANRCMILCLCMLNLPSSCAHTNTRTNMYNGGI